jgi:hypothetical protein
MEFNVLQVSLLPVDSELFAKKHLDKDIKLFEDALDKAKERNDEFSIKVYIKDLDKGVMSGVVSKKTDVKLHDRNFKLHQEEDFPPVVWFWDREEQVILVENKRSVFSSASVASKTFENIANNITLAENSLRAHIKPKLVESAFWDTFNSFNFVSEVRLSLVTPNLFGKTKKEIGEFLHEVSDETNASEFSPVFKNPDGNLHLKPSAWLNAMIDWIKDGAGEWSIRGKRKPKDKYKTINSKQRVKLLLVEGQITEVDLENYKSEEVNEIISMLRNRYTHKK